MNAEVSNRRLGSWIDAYQEYTEITPSPPIFRKWVAISYVAAALERKVWVRTMGTSLYPGLYIFLVGPPGIGKGQAIHLGELILRAVPEIHVGPSDMTSASLIDALNESVRRIVLMGDPPLLEFNSLTVISRELGVLIPSWDTAFMNNLTDIYDGFTVDQKRRGKELRIKIANPQINLLGACTPGYLSQTMPSGAWDQGFISRTILIYSGHRTTKDPFMDESAFAATTRLHNDLLHDLKSIGSTIGQMSFTTPAAAAIKAWIKSGCKPEPAHPKLQFYNSRRIAHLLKLCMICSMSRTSDKIISLEHYAEALDWLVEAERYMPDIFKSMVSGGDSAAMEEAWNYVWTLYSKEHKPIAEHRIVHFLRERVPAHGIMKVLEIMVKSKMIEISIGESGFNGYKPTSREARLTGDPTAS
jgi:hypothetical protein